MLRVRNLQTGYNDFQLYANFVVRERSLVAIVGPSGSGKTTLLNTIAGFMPVSVGEVEWKEESITNVSPGKRPVSVLFQDHNLFPHLSVEKNVAIGLKANLKLNSSEQDQVFEAIRKVGLEKYITKKPSELSGGQKTRIALARAMIRCKPLLLLDEAFLGLGPALRLEMLALIMDFVHEEKMTLLMVSHDINDALKLNQKIIFIHDGQVIGPMDIAEFLCSSDLKFREYLGDCKKKV